MASAVTATYQFGDGAAYSVTVQVADSCPDALNQARGEAVRGLEELMDNLDHEDED